MGEETEGKARDCSRPMKKGMEKGLLEIQINKYKMYDLNQCRELYTPLMINVMLFIIKEYQLLSLLVLL